MTIWAFRGRRALLRVRRGLWQELIRELGRRGRGERESGAFLLGHRKGDHRTVTRVVYLDDLDPSCLTGGITFDGFAYSKLWDLCDDEKLYVIGDIHTHPARGVHQSSIDAENPMLASKGHVALIVPDFSTRQIEAREVGVHRYDGTGWTAWTDDDASRRLFIRRFV